MPKCCGDNSPKELNVMNTGPKILISYEHTNYGNHRVVGPATKEYYGYMGGGGKHQFEVYEADVRARPDIFIPVAKRKEQLLAQKEAIERQLAADEQVKSPTIDAEVSKPEPPAESVQVLTPAYAEPGSTIDSPSDEYLANLDLPQGVSTRQITALSDANIDTVAEFQAYLDEGNDLTEIPGIADASAKKLSKMVRDYLAGA